MAQSFKVGDRIVLTGSYWQEATAYRDGGIATVTETDVEGDETRRYMPEHALGYFKMENGAGNFLMSDEYIARHPQYAWRLEDEWDPKDDHQDSLTFRTGSNRTISVGWGQGTKDAPKVQLSVHGTSVALTHEELEVLALTLVKAKEENERIFKG